MTYWEYLKSQIRHKAAVFRAGRLLKVPLWLLVVHDWSKFLPSELISYARYFYGNYQSLAEMGVWAREHGIRSKEDVERDFDVAWLHHQHRNKHHWQRWLLTLDSARSDGRLLALPMPEKYVREMLADWMGASYAYTKQWVMSNWLAQNGPKLQLHEATVQLVHGILVCELHYMLTDNCDWSFAASEKTLEILEQLR